MRNYFFAPAPFPEVPRVAEAKNDDFFFRQGPTKGLGKIQFHDYNLAYRSVDLPNANLFKKQIEVLKEFLILSAGDATAAGAQAKDIDFLLTLGELFTLVAYGQLIIEFRNLNREEVSDDLLEQIFDVLVRDFSTYALQLYSKPSGSRKQMETCLKMIMKPDNDPVRFKRIWKEQVYALADAYKMND
jgi:acyl-CoA dehydrogenase